jgi:hypothetical protein
MGRSQINGKSGETLEVNADGSVNVSLNGSNLTDDKPIPIKQIGSMPTGSNTIGTVNLAANGLSIGTGGNLPDTTSGNGNLAMAHYLYNGATWDRNRNNIEGSVLASATRTSITNSPKQTNHNAKALVIYLDVTAASGTGGLTPFLRLYDPVTGKTVVINVLSSAITAIGTYAFVIGLGASGTVTNSVKSFVSSIISRQYDIQIYHNDASSYTYSVGQCLVV